MGGARMIRRPPTSAAAWVEKPKHGMTEAAGGRQTEDAEPSPPSAAAWMEGIGTASRDWICGMLEHMFLVRIDSVQFRSTDYDIPGQG